MVIEIVVIGLGVVLKTNDMHTASTEFFKWMVMPEKRTVVMVQDGELVTSFWGNDFRSAA